MSLELVKDGIEVRFIPPSQKLIDEASDLVVSACKKAFGGSLECVTLKGSAVKGDFIPGYSDFDFHVFLNSKVMESERIPKINYALRFQKAFGHVNPKNYGVSQFQIYFIDSQRYPADWTPSVEGTFKVVWGKMPFATKEADNQGYIRQANESLKTVWDTRRNLVGRFVDKPDTQISSFVRLLGTFLKGYMYSVLVLLADNPKVGLRLPLDKMVVQVEKGINSKGHFTIFFDKIFDWTTIQQNSDKARETLKEGIKALEEIAHWYNHH